MYTLGLPAARDVVFGSRRRPKGWMKEGVAAWEGAVAVFFVTDNPAAQVVRVIAWVSHPPTIVAPKRPSPRQALYGVGLFFCSPGR